MIWWQFLIKRCLIYIHAYGGYSLLHLSPLKTKICIHLHFYCWNEASHPAAAVRSTRNRKDHLENSCRNYHPCYSLSAVDAPRQSPPLVMAWFIESRGRRENEYKLCVHTDACGSNAQNRVFAPDCLRWRGINHQIKQELGNLRDWEGKKMEPVWTKV